MIAALAATAALSHLAAQDPVIPQVPPKTPPPRVQDTKVPTPILAPTNDAAPISAAPLTLAEATRIALDRQPAIASAQGVVRTAQGVTQQSAAPGNPQVLAGAGYDSVRSLSGNGTALQAPTNAVTAGMSPAFPYSTSIVARQLLFDFNQIRNTVRKNKALTDVAVANLSRTQQNVVNATEIAFYNVVNGMRQVAVSEQNLANRQRQLDLANSRFRNDVGLPIDVVTAETSKSQAVLALQNARDLELQARFALLQAMGIDPMTPVEIAAGDEAAVAASDPKALVARGLERRPEVRAAYATVAASKYGLSAAKALNLPSIYLTAAAGTVGDSLSDSHGTGSIGLGFQFSLIDGGQRKGAVQAASGQIATALADLSTAVLNVRTDVGTAYVALLAAEGRVPTVDSEVANAREGVRIAEGRYAAGLGLFLDVTTAQGQLLTALQDQTNVQSQVNLARVRLRYAIGDIAPAPLPGSLTSSPRT